MGSAAGAMAVGLIMLAAPAAGASANLTLIAPYKHTTSSNVAYTAATCGTAGGKAAKWAPVSGKVTGASSASATGCPAYVTSSPSASASHSVVVGIPFKVGSYALYNVTASWMYQIKGSSAAPNPGCPAAFNWTSGYDYVYCYAYSTWNLGVSLAIWDTSNGTKVSPGYSIWYAGNYSDNFNSGWCIYGSCGSSTGAYNCSSSYAYQSPWEDYANVCLPPGTSSGTGSLWTNTSNYWALYNSGMNFSLVPYDSYALVATFTFSSYVSLYYWEFGYSGSSYYSFPLPYSATAKAMVSGLSANGASLTSVVATPV